jgi:parvulin-like peptidyl-prolyl isomerase
MRKYTFLFKKISRLVFSVLVLVVLIVCQRQQPQKEVVVRVGMEALTLADIANDIPRQIRHRITKDELQDYVVRWINSQILYQEAKRRKLDQSLDLRREMHRLERELMVNALLDQELEKPLNVTEEEIQNYYNENRGNFTRSANEIHAWYINVGNRKTADSLYTELRKGGDFSQVAHRFADGDSAAWDLFLTEEETAPAIANQIFTMTTGSISRPIALDDGFHIFKIVQKMEAGSLRPLHQARDEIAAKIQTEKRHERYKQLLAELKTSSVIETNFQMLESLPVDSILARASR